MPSERPYVATIAEHHPPSGDGVECPGRTKQTEVEGGMQWAMGVMVDVTGYGLVR